MSHTLRVFDLHLRVGKWEDNDQNRNTRPLHSSVPLRRRHSDYGKKPIHCNLIKDPCFRSPPYEIHRRMATSASRVLAIDVECVATGYTHEDRAPCSVAVVDEQCQLIFSSLIKPIGKCVSDLYAFTGLRLSELDQAPTYDEVMAKVRRRID